MNRAARYVSALLVAGVITAIVGLIDPAPTLLFGIFVIYAVTTEIVLRYPELLGVVTRRAFRRGYSVAERRLVA